MMPRNSDIINQYENVYHTYLKFNDLKCIKPVRKMS